MDGQSIINTSYRISEEDKSKITQIMQETGMKQHELLAAFVQSWEINKGKELYKSSKNTLDKMEEYLRAISELFLTEIANKENIKEIIRNDFISQVESKDSTIILLQNQIKSIEQSCQAYQNEKKEYEKMLQSYETSMEQIKKNNTDAEEKLRLSESNVQTLKRALSTYEEMADKFKETDTKIEILESQNAEKDKIILSDKEKINEMENKIAQLSGIIDTNEKKFKIEIETMSQRNNAAMEMLKAEEQHKAMAQIQAERDKTQASIEKWQLLYTALLEKGQNKKTGKKTIEKK